MLDSLVPTPPARLLLFDVEQGRRDRREAELRALGHEVVAVGSSDDARVAFDSSDAIVVALDGDLERRDACQTLNSLLRGSDAAPLLCLARSDAEAVEAYRRGARDVLVEPFSSALLSAKVASLLSHADARRGSRATVMSPVLRIFDSIDEGFCVIKMLFSSDGEPCDYRFLMVNAAFETQTGLRQATGRTIRAIEPHLEEHWFHVYGNVARTGEPVRFIAESGALGRWFDVYAFSVGERAANEVGVLFRDVTAVRRAEDALHKSQRRLRFALAAGSMGTWDLDLRTQQLDASPTCRANFGRGAHEPFTYQDLTQAVLEEDRPDLQAAMKRAVDHCGDVDVHYRAHWPDGSVHWIHMRGTCSANDQGRAAAMSGVTQRVDEQKRVEEELRAADRHKDEFLTTASHELRTPLTAILGWARMLRTPHLEPGTYARAAEVIERNAQAQVQLVEDILDGSRIITGKLRLEVRTLDLTAVVRSAVEAVTPAAIAKGIDLVVSLDPAAAPVLGDPDRLQQVVWNLASNAIKFTPRGGRVDIALKRGGTGIDLVVSDTGQGIAADFLPHVFERFRQADASTTRRHGGLGLGLALVRHLVEAHGGKVRAESDGPGHGATFTVSLPIRAVLTKADSFDAPREARTSPAVAPADVRDVSVLVVDDEADARELIAEVLRSNGARVTTASDAASALELIAVRPPAVLISDVGMPDVDGYQLMRQVRSQTGTRASQVQSIALTAYARAEDRRRALDAGFHEHLSKPVDPAVLLRAVSEMAKVG